MKTLTDEIIKITNPVGEHKLPVGVGINIRWKLTKPIKGAVIVKLYSKGKNRIQLADGIFYSMSLHGEIVINRSVFEENSVGDEINCELEFGFMTIGREHEPNNVSVKISRYPTLNHASWVDNHRDIAGRKPIIFIHGLNPTFPGREDRAWDPMLLKLSTDDIDLFNDFMPFIFSYDSSDVLFAESNSPSIVDVSEHLDSEIARMRNAKMFNSDEVYVVAHSMGGLVTRTMMTKGVQKIHMLITLATPHHGTPAASLFKGYIGSNFINEISWDNFDEFYNNDKTPNNFLKELNNSEHNKEVAGKIVAFAGKVVDPKKSLIELINPLRMGLDFFKHKNDGAVPISSALFEGGKVHARETFDDVDHFSICKDEKVISKVVEYLKEKLY